MLAQRLLGSDRQRERLPRAFGNEQSGIRFADAAIGEKSELLLVQIPVWERNLLGRAFLRVTHERCLELSRLDNEAMLECSALEHYTKPDRERKTARHDAAGEHRRAAAVIVLPPRALPAAAAVTRAGRPKSHWTKSKSKVISSVEGSL